jgi:glycosyltransferase involved in cell wall biosynthesis
MRTWALLRALAAEGHSIVLLAFADRRELDGNETVLNSVCERVEWVPREHASLSMSRDYLARFSHIFLDMPHSVLGFRSQSMKKRIHQLVDSERIDAIFCEETQPLVNVGDHLPVPLILDNQNVEHLILSRYTAYERNPVKRLYARLEARKLKNWERQSCQRAAVACACSEYDRALLQALSPEVPVVVVPNIVDTDTYQPGGLEDKSKLLYQGGMDWYPNRDAVEFFVTQIFLRIRRQVPDVKFVVAGRNPPEEFRQRLSSIPGIQFTGTVPDMRSEIASAAVCVVPLRIGSGTRLKILEAAAMAKPIVSTRLGAEGLEFQDGQEIVLADEPAAFADAVVKLLRAAPDRVRLGQAARKRAEQDYSFHALGASLRSTIRVLTDLIDHLQGKR